MPLSYEKDILILFTDSQVACMRDGVQWPLNDLVFMLDPAGDEKYPDHWRARKVYARLLPTAGTRRMPRGGPYWSDANLDLYRRWMEDGFLP